MGIAQARKQGKPHGRPRSAARKQAQVHELSAQGVSKAEIAPRLAIGCTSVRRLLQIPDERFQGVPSKTRKPIHHHGEQ